MAAASPDRETMAVIDELPTGLRLGTSSWHFPGWRGLVWRDDVPGNTLSKHGLTAYSALGLFRSVSLDRTYYAPIDAELFRQYAGQVPDDFRFVVKAWSALTEPRVDGQKNTRFLSAEVANQVFLSPAVRGLAHKLGLLHLQFSPGASRLFAKYLARFVERLDQFFYDLTEGPRWSVELREPSLYCDSVFEVLDKHRAIPCLGVHPSVPETRNLAARIGDHWPELSIRWNLQPTLGYERAKSRYAPFDQLVDPDPMTRQTLANVAAEYLEAGKDVTVIANNKAEGSAPLTLLELAKLLLMDR